MLFTLYTHHILCIEHGWFETKKIRMTRMRQKFHVKFVCEAKQNNCYSVIFGSSNISLFCLYVIYIPFIRVCVCVYWYGTAEWKYRRFDIYYRIIVFFLSMVGWILLFRLNHIIYNINYSIHTKSDKKKRKQRIHTIIHSLFSACTHRTLPTFCSTGMCVQ